VDRRVFIGTFAGGLLAAPFVVEAQQAGKIPRIGVLWHAGSAEEEDPYFTTLLAGFKDLGYVDGRNIAFLHRFPNEVPERFERMAAELVSLNIDALVSVGSVAPSYAKRATRTVPVVFILVADPVGAQLVETLSRPGGNVTGVSFYSSPVVTNPKPRARRCDQRADRRDVVKSYRGVCGKPLFQVIGADCRC